MADIKSLFIKMGTNGSGGAGDAGPDQASPPKAAKASKKNNIEKTYQKKSQLEHILLRPDTYIGSVEKQTESMWIYDTEAEKMVQKQVEYVPGLYKIFDEILVNAADNKQRDKKMDCIKIEIKQEENLISVWNNGQGIPVVMHKDENMYVPTMIFGHLLTSSNYNDEEEKVTGGRNGYGAKLCNIFSTKFTVETATKEYKKQFKQTWGSNMTKASDPKVKEFFGDDFTKISFSPDLAKFKMDKLDDDIVGIMSRRAYDIAASARGVKVFLNGKKVAVKNFKDYVDMYVKGNEDDSGNNLKVVHEVCSERWEVALTLSERGFQQMSFVNSIATTKGGRHVDYVTDMVVKQLIEVLKKKNKGGVNIKPFQVKNHMWVFINCLIVNPTFDSQTKENMTLQMKSFGSKCALSDKFIAAVTKSGIVESVLSWAKFKAQNELEKKGGRKQSKLKGIPKLEDANEAGTKNALKCTLILTEGDSAKSLAVSGLAVIGRDNYGVFPLRGKLLNVREATHKQILENAEINNLIKIIGLQYKKKYNNEDDMKTLRYGKVMIMTDQDQDGSHIKGLLINFIHHNWPELLRQNFLEEFITPIVKAKKRTEVFSFYSLPEFEEWKANTPNHHTFNIKYYKGLGTSTSVEAKEYFQNMARHRIRFRYGGQEDDDHIVLAFSRKHIEHRKEWLTNFMVESRRRKEIGLPEVYLYGKDTKFVSYADFVNLELVLFSNADNIRSIPCLVDGFKPGQRKILFTCLKRNDKREVKVAQLAGSVAEHSAYHHGEVSLCMTIVNLAQNYVGSNNINLLEPRGQFGTRLSGGKDSASPRYIFTKLSPMARMIFHPHDDPLLKHEYDDNLKIEPVWYMPVIPMILVNGAEGIGTGWSTKIANYNPREIATNLRRMMDGDEPNMLHPWYKNFKGTIEYCGDNRYCCSGEIAIIGDDKIEITELPVGTWTQNYKENVLEPLLTGSEKVKALVQDYKEYNTDTTVKFVVTLMSGQLTVLEREGLHKVFKLQTMFSTSSMCAFDELGCLKRYDSVMQILKEFYDLRLKHYQKRKDYLEGVLEAEAAKLTNQARFIMEKCGGELVVENKKRKTIVDELIKKGYAPDPVKTWKERNNEEEEAQAPEEEHDEDEEGSSTKKKKPVDTEAEFKNLAEVKKFDYLLGMSMWMLTDERKNELLRQKDQKMSELDILRKKTKVDLYREDLDALLEKLDVVEEKERKELANVPVKKEKGVAGRKKANLTETMPSPMAERVAPKITEEMKKKIQQAQRVKENKGKGRVKKENISLDGEEKDEFDAMVQSKKTLKDKLGTPEEIEKKAKGKKAVKKESDGMKQTKLNFSVSNGSPKKRGKARKIAADDSDDDSAKKKKQRGRKKRSEDSDDDDDAVSFGSDQEIDFAPSPVKERTNRRAAAKPVKYALSDDESEKMSDVELELKDNAAVAEKENNVAALSDSEDEEKPPPPHETSEDMFDSLVGKTKEAEKKPAAPKRKQTERSQSESDASFNVSEKDDSDDEFEAMCKPKKGKAKPKAAAKPAKKKKKTSDSEDDDKPIKSKAKPKKKKVMSDSEDDEPIRPKKKYMESSDEDSF
ncbi:unnamed protein product [Brassicogethes aeneus]|uniref:DNA topoisomerase 2 n=1 Tax=Brassicogethes aeneus TaxID=1431903 RepID=A0A9P0FAC0_BRAAE|nr:unnamed protein product [Brassicogethes aeneus]